MTEPARNSNAWLVFNSLAVLLIVGGILAAIIFGLSLLG